VVPMTVYRTERCSENNQRDYAQSRSHRFSVYGSGAHPGTFISTRYLREERKRQAKKEALATWSMLALIVISIVGGVCAAVIAL